MLNSGGKFVILATNGRRSPYSRHHSTSRSRSGRMYTTGTQASLMLPTALHVDVLDLAARQAAISKRNGATNTARRAHAAVARTVRQIDETAVFGMVSSVKADRRHRHIEPRRQDECSQWSFGGQGLTCGKIGLAPQPTAPESGRNPGRFPTAVLDIVWPTETFRGDIAIVRSARDEWWQLVCLGPGEPKTVT